MKRGWISLILIVLLFSPIGWGTAQGQEPAGPVYIVQPGDTLWGIAQRFGVSMDALMQANGMTDANALAAGVRLVIPGLDGISGTLVTEPVPYGESLRSLSRRYVVPTDVLVRLNHLASPAELFAGSDVVIPEAETPPVPTRRVLMEPGRTLLELAVLNKANPWTIVAANTLSGTWDALPGDVLRLPGEAPDGPGALPEAVTGVEITPLPTFQGKTTVIRLSGDGTVTLSGSFTDHTLHFFAEDTGDYAALQGIHAMLAPGFYPLTISGTLASGAPFSFSQWVYVQNGGYPYEDIQGVDPATLDPAVTAPENELWFSLTAAATPDRRWDGMFQMPSPFSIETGFPSYYGNRRSYNGGAYDFFHTGLDMYGQVGTEIFAPAAGVVVFAGPLTVRGNATVIDHGWGVFTAYMHQSEFKVAVGETVEPGQVIGLVGGTGRVNGPHLHFEVWVGGVQVNPLDWLTQVYP